jgi:predicted aspartyl protease
MIRGVVNARREAVVRLRVRGPSGVESDIDVIVDSGFTASLTLPLTIVTALGLARQSGSSAVLVDGSICPFDIFAAELGSTK